MVTYDTTDKTLFSADAFGTFGAMNGNLFADEVNFERDWLDDARRYYTNIVGKYGASVQTLLKKAAGLEIATICPLHGPVWRENISWYVDKYLTWSSYAPEEKSVIDVYKRQFYYCRGLGKDNGILYTTIPEEGRIFKNNPDPGSHLL